MAGSKREGKALWAASGSRQRAPAAQAVPAGQAGEPLTGVVLIAAGDAHTCALMEAGGVKCWGYNGAGQVGVDLGWNPAMVVGFESYYRVLAPLLQR
jgi:hypothetical protein